MELVIEELKAEEPMAVASLSALLPQLAPAATKFGVKELRAILACEATTLLVAKRDGRIVGMLTLVRFPLPSGVRAFIEDVVVDTGARGQGVGEALTREAIRLAGDSGAVTVDLSSRPSREAANRLYRRIGFVPRQSTLYRYPLTDTDV
ncbi:GNAT family N-acetyltransferase [Streptomyces sp. NPDC050418]|uniref:GNAT family N-acetyltransferase n=1 Tax=Streptomyces sp. NPDC050418 TaxID=3365612 RepID=UPI0037905A7D